MYRISVQITGEKRVEQKFRSLRRNITDFSVGFRVIAHRFHQVERELFATEGASGGAPWAPLSPAYATWKRKHYPGRTILHLFGPLRKSLTQHPSTGSIEDVSPTQLRMGTRIPYGIRHQKGEGRLPVRKPLVVTPSEMRSWAKILNKSIWSGVV
jgi:phage gpG-like protein